MYLPPFAELRGGAWVVLDSLINSPCIEMYAAENARANVLEPTGTIGLKYRKEQLLATMHRLDQSLINLDKQLNDIKTKSQPYDENNKLQIEKEIENRERSLLTVYSKISLMFAELHDTPGRMKTVGVISDIVDWKNSRRFFYWRLRKRLIYHQCIRKIAEATNIEINGDITQNENAFTTVKQQFEEWVNNKRGNNNVNNSKDSNSKNIDINNNENKNDNNEDQQFVEWFDKNTSQFNEYLNLSKKKESLKNTLQNTLQTIAKQYPGEIKELQNIINGIVHNNETEV